MKCAGLLKIRNGFQVTAFMKRVYLQAFLTLFSATVASEQTKTWSDANIILLVQKIKKMHMLPKHELIMWLQDREQAWMKFFIRVRLRG